jgi:hypothetical protein
VIQQVPAFQVGQLVFPTLQEAQRHEIEALFPSKEGGKCVFSPEEIASVIVGQTDEIVAILTCAPRTKKPRSDKDKKRAKKEATPAVV